MRTRRSQALVTSIACLILLLPAATGVSQTIDLPRTVPSYNQAYTDGTGAWGHCPLGTHGCPDEIWMTGCLITAFSSVLAYYEIDVMVPARSSCTGQARSGMDPGLFNDWLREAGGYGRCAQDPAGNCCLIWERLPAELEIATHINRSEVGVDPLSSVVIDHALRQGQPVIAGVHWSAFCNGASSQSEDCHWVVITGKRGNTYAIIDPFNPDASSPNGVRTTLDAGVRGSYIIDRFVVVAGPPPGPVHLDVAAIPTQPTYDVGDRIQLTSKTPGRSVALMQFARVTRPSGQVEYAVLADATSRSPRYLVQRDSLVPDPRVLSTGWTWYDRTFTEADIGRWTWEIWVERADHPGIKLDQRTVSYEVKRMTGLSSTGTALLGIVLVVVIAAVALLSTLHADAN